MGNYNWEIEQTVRLRLTDLQNKRRNIFFGGCFAASSVPADIIPFTVTHSSWHPPSLYSSARRDRCPAQRALRAKLTRPAP